MIICVFIWYTNFFTNRFPSETSSWDGAKHLNNRFFKEGGTCDKTLKTVVLTPLDVYRSIFALLIQQRELITRKDVTVEVKKHTIYKRNIKLSDQINSVMLLYFLFTSEMVCQIITCKQSTGGVIVKC